MWHWHKLNCTVLALLVFTVISGCIHNEYEIEMHPDGDSMQRTVRVKLHEKTEDAKEEIDSVSRDYDTPAILQDSAIELQSTFQDRMPDDVGGYGQYHTWSTRMGTAYAYSERFRGQDNLKASLDDRQQAVAELGKIISEWLLANFKEHPQLPKLNDFLSDQVLPDLMNLSLYVWAAQIADESGTNLETSDEFVIRIGQYLLERDYFELEQMPQLTRLLEDESGELGVAYVRSLIANKLDLDQQDEALEFLSTAQRAQKSLFDFVQTTEEFKKDYQAKQSNPANQSVDNFFGDLLFRSSGLSFNSGDQVSVRMQLPVMPYSTNGEWLKEENTVSWTDTINSRGEISTRVLPVVNYALWAVPDEGFQEKHFGSVLIDGQNLMDYNLWRKSLSTAERNRWNAFVDQLQPDGTLAGQFTDFTLLSNTQVTSEGKPFDLARTICDRLVQQLQNKSHVPKDGSGQD